MKSPDEIEILTERRRSLWGIDDMPVLIERLKQMKVAEIIDRVVVQHALWEEYARIASAMNSPNINSAFSER